MARYERIIGASNRVTMSRTQGTNQVRFHGIDHGNGSKPILIAVETPDIVVVKIPGGKHWTGNYMDWASHPGHYKVFMKMDDESGDWVVELAEFPLRTVLETRHG